MTQYTSTVFYHVMKPQWRETLRFSVQKNVLEHSWIVFLIFHVSLKSRCVRHDECQGYMSSFHADFRGYLCRPDKLHQPNPMAFGMLKVTTNEGLVVPDGVSEVLLYKWNGPASLIPFRDLIRLTAGMCDSNAVTFPTLCF